MATPRRCSATAAQFTSLSTVGAGSDQVGQHLGRGQLAGQERGVRQLDQPPGVPVHRVGRADRGGQHGGAGAGQHLARRRPQQRRPAGWRRSAPSPRCRDSARSRPRRSCRSASTPSGPACTLSAHPAPASSCRLVPARPAPAGLQSHLAHQPAAGQPAHALRDTVGLDSPVRVAISARLSSVVLEQLVEHVPVGHPAQQLQRRQVAGRARSTSGSVAHFVRTPC